jgi:hypothetical protein
MSNLTALADRLESIPPGPALRFTLVNGEGFVTASREATIRTLCDLYNARVVLASTMRLADGAARDRLRLNRALAALKLAQEALGANTARDAVEAAITEIENG